MDLANDQVTTVAGSGQEGGRDGNFANTQFRNFRAMVRNGSVLYGVDFQGGTIRKLDLLSSESTTIAGQDTDLTVRDGPLLSARFHSPRGMAIGDATSDLVLFVAEYNQEVIRKVNLTQGSVTTVAGLQYSTTDNDGSLPGARFARPASLFVDPSNSDILYVTTFKVDFHVSSILRRIWRMALLEMAPLGPRLNRLDQDGPETAAVLIFWGACVDPGAPHPSVYSCRLSRQ